MFSDKEKEIKKAKDEGLNVYFMTYVEYDNCWQLEEIRLGLESHVNVEIYAKPVYTWAQMHEIRLGLESNLNVTPYLDNKFSYKQMRLIREGLEQNIDVSQYANPKYSKLEMEEIYNRLCQSK